MTRFARQVLVDGPSSEEQTIVPRHVLPLANATLTHFTIPKLPRAAGTGPVKKLWANNEIDAKWAKSNYAQKTEGADRRKNLTDFERFKVLRLRKQVRSAHSTRNGIALRRIIYASTQSGGIHREKNGANGYRLVTRSRSLSLRPRRLLLRHKWFHEARCKCEGIPGTVFPFAEGFFF